MQNSIYTACFFLIQILAIFGKHKPNLFPVSGQNT